MKGKTGMSAYARRMVWTMKRVSMGFALTGAVMIASTGCDYSSAISEALSSIDFNSLIQQAVDSLVSSTSTTT